MIYDEFARISTRVLEPYEGSGSVEITAIEPSPRGPLVRWQAPMLATERGRIRKLSGGQRGPVPGPVILNLLSETLAARWRHGSPHCPPDWGERLIQRYKRVFQMHLPSTGPGWCWLWQAGANQALRAGLPRGFRTTDAKEKFGGARWYVGSDDDCQAIYDVVEALEALSTCICEDCGRPGHIRRGSWIRCQCDLHAKK